MVRLLFVVVMLGMCCRMVMWLRLCMCWVVVEYVV